MLLHRHVGIFEWTKAQASRGSGLLQPVGLAGWPQSFALSGRSSRFTGPRPHVSLHMGHQSASNGASEQPSSGKDEENEKSEM